MATWKVALALGVLLDEINQHSPTRSKASDGGIGDARHGARKSDHNPCECCQIVCARDFTHDPPRFDSYAFADWLRTRVLAHETRVKYVISNGRIYSGQGQHHAPGMWRPYTGSNKHSHHVHVSVRHDLADDTRPWGWHCD
jgi:hypothetical protein